MHERWAGNCLSRTVRLYIQRVQRSEAKKPDASHPAALRGPTAHSWCMHAHAQMPVPRCYCISVHAHFRTAEPEDEPPGMCPGAAGLVGVP